MSKIDEVNFNHHAKDLVTTTSGGGGLTIASEERNEHGTTTKTGDNTLNVSNQDLR